MIRRLKVILGQLVKSDAFTGLRVESMDSSMVCMIKASYECEIEANIDITGELVAMMTAQRAYQANAQTIKTQDQVLQTLLNLR